VLDNTMAGEGNQFIYNYSLVNKSKDKFENIETLEKKIKDNLINKFKNDEELFFFRKNKINIICNYRDKNKELFMKIDLKSEEYADDPGKK